MGRTSNPKRERNSFFLYVCNVLGTYELHVGYKTSKGDIVPLSNSKQCAKVKIPIGPPTECEFRVRNIASDEMIAEYKFTNSRRQSVALKDSLLNNVDFGINNFTRKITGFTLEGKKKLLAIYLSLINFTGDFVHHRESIHDSNGFLLTGDGVTANSLLEAGGSIEDFEQFVELAKQSAPMDIAKNSDNAFAEVVKSIQSSKKRKAVSTDGAPVDNSKQLKLSKTQNMENNERKELEDEEGLERAYQDSLCGVALVPLDNISVCPKMQLKINPFRVQYIKTSMMKRYNPALSVLVICPVNESKKIDVNKDKFYVVQKVKCLLSFKEIDKSGDLVKLHGHRNRKVLCYVLDSNKAEIMQYANLTENYISGQFASRTVPQDILHHFLCLTVEDSSVKALKVVQRMCNLCCIRPEECTALERICKWSREGFATFMAVLEKFESYQTKDIKGARLALRISRGLKLNLPNILLRLLGKVSEKYFLEHKDQVLNQTLSLRELAENYQELLEVEKVLKVLSKIAQFVPVETLQTLHPGKFEGEIMIEYIGAVFDDKVKNQKTIELEKYYEFVISNPVVEIFAKPIQFVVFEEVNKILEDEDNLAGLDMIIYNIETVTKENINNVFTCILGGDKTFHTALLLFPSELDYYEIISFLRSQSTNTSMIKHFEIVPLLFNKALDNGDGKKIAENIQYGLLFGKFIVLKSPLMVHYNDTSQIIKVIESICPSGGRIGLVSDPGLLPIQLHNQDLLWKVTYFGTDADLKKFKKKLASDKTPVVLSNEEEEAEESDKEESEESGEEESGNENVPTTSTTPVKPRQEKSAESILRSREVVTPVFSAAPNTLDDSGFLEDTPKARVSLDFSPGVTEKESEIKE